MRRWWWLRSCCPGLGNARMADLRMLCRDQAIGPDHLWGWPIEHLGQALAWPAYCLRDVERYVIEYGAAPKLDVPACALLPAAPDWPGCFDDVHTPPSGLYVEGDRSLLRHICARTVIAVAGTRSASDHRLPWLNNWAVSWPRQVGQSLVVLRKGLTLQSTAAVLPETVHPSRCWGQTWTVSIQPTTDRCNSRSAGKGC